MQIVDAGHASLFLGNPSHRIVHWQSSAEQWAAGPQPILLRLKLISPAKSWAGAGDARAVQFLLL
jgi:hypothetical protein